MKTKDFYFDLPHHLIAQYPSPERGKSRLMILDRKTETIAHSMIGQLPKILKDEKPLLVFNDTKVRKARIFGKSVRTGSLEEFLLLSSENEKNTQWKAISKHIKRKKTGNIYNFCELEAEIINFTDDGFLILEFRRSVNDDWLEKHGHVPLPPYIKRVSAIKTSSIYRKDEQSDSNRYQTIYAKETGSVAAPTAGLHFNQSILDELAFNGIETAFITLHVGLGTFLPVRCENIEDHKMHEEQFVITDENADKIEKAKRENKKIIAVGTTSLRTLESAFTENKLIRGSQKTSIFIYPGYKFKIADSLFTNFHTPESTLLMLVCAFAGKDLIFKSYDEAIKKEYRFFSYGDAMLII